VKNFTAGRCGPATPTLTKKLSAKWVRVMGYLLKVIGVEEDEHPGRRRKTARSKTQEEEAASSSTLDF
jgi:hypothetical protein